ncbi:MAG: class I SAM-dependent methyltransferase [Pseudomonadota bacterium]|nr:class I SAM-dependent methyltransferase [Pseudomonadota bacterium]
MSESQNEALPAWGGYGHETSTAYMDAHERLLYALIQLAVQQGKTVRALDLACDRGTTSQRLAEAGAHVVAVDLNLETKARLENSERIEFIQSDIRDLPETVCRQKFDFILFQRALDCIPSPDGIRVLKSIQDMLKPHGKLFMTVSSPEADYAAGYEGRNVPLEKRFHELAPEFQREHHFFQKICMYGKEELLHILRRQDWRVDVAFMSASGSNKIVARKPPWWQTRQIRTMAAAASLVALSWPVSGIISRSQAPQSPENLPETSSQVDIEDLIENSETFAMTRRNKTGKEIVVLASAPYLHDPDAILNLKETLPSRWRMKETAIEFSGQNYTVYYVPRYRPHYVSSYTHGLSPKP